MLAALVAAAALTTPLHAQSSSAAQWINTVNATPSGSSLQKTGGCGGCADAGGTSAQSIAGGDGYVEFTPVVSARLYAGLGANATANTDPAQIDFAFSFWPDGGWDVREKNLYKSEGRFVSGDVFRVAIVSGAVKYYKNGALVYSSASVPPYPLVFDTALLDAGATVSNATMGGVSSPAPPVAVAVTTTSVADAIVSQPYAATLTATGGSGSYTWSLTSGALPSGLALSPAGTIGGIPSAGGSFTFVVRARDAVDVTNIADRTLTLNAAHRAGSGGHGSGHAGGRGTIHDRRARG
jgi:hypothetical protein